MSAGGSYLMVQRYQHDLAAWNALSVEEQQRAIGREKLSNVELPDEDTPPSAHRMLTSITDDSGRELAILRDNMPFGSPAAGEFGTYFVGYAKSHPVTAARERPRRRGTGSKVPTRNDLRPCPGLARAA